MIGVLALQGGVSEHERNLARVGARTRQVRRPEDLAGLSGLVLPGGESSALRILIEAAGLVEPIWRLLMAGLPVWGTCAGVVLLSRGGLWPVVNAEIERNAYGPQLYSRVWPAATRLGNLDLVFIRAPRLRLAEREGLTVLAELEGEGVALRQANVLLTCFHPELARDDCFAPYFCGMAAQSS
jgi:5'-phosphate synthase pdxT subunit